MFNISMIQYFICIVSFLLFAANVPQVPSRRPPPALPPQNHESSPPIARRSQPITPQHNNKVGPVQIDPYTPEIPSTDAIYFEPVELSEIEPWSPLPPPRPARPSRAGSTQHLSVGESKVCIVKLHFSLNESFIWNCKKCSSYSLEAFVLTMITNMN